MDTVLRPNTNRQSSFPFYFSRTKRFKQIQNSFKCALIFQLRGSNQPASKQSCCCQCSYSTFKESHRHGCDSMTEFETERHLYVLENIPAKLSENLSPFFQSRQEAARLLQQFQLAAFGSTDSRTYRLFLISYMVLITTTIETPALPTCMQSVVSSSFCLQPLPIFFFLFSFLSLGTIVGQLAIQGSITSSSSSSSHDQLQEFQYTLTVGLLLATYTSFSKVKPIEIVFRARIGSSAWTEVLILSFILPSSNYYD